jgi:hypothetical protein
LLRIPDTVGPKLLRDARKSKTTIQAVILSILATHYSVDVEPPKRGARKKSE